MFTNHLNGFFVQVEELCALFVNGHIYASLTSGNLLWYHPCHLSPVIRKPVAIGLTEITLELSGFEALVYILLICGTAETFPFACLLNTGAKDQCAMDTLLWDPQWFCTGVQLDLGAEGPGGLWHWRSASVVSKYSQVQISLFYLLWLMFLKMLVSN